MARMKILVCFELEMATELGGKANGDSVVECSALTEDSVDKIREYLLNQSTGKVSSMSL